MLPFSLLMKTLWKKACIFGSVLIFLDTEYFAPVQGRGPSRQSSERAAAQNFLHQSRANYVRTSQCDGNRRAQAAKKSQQSAMLGQLQSAEEILRQQEQKKVRRNLDALHDREVTHRAFALGATTRPIRALPEITLPGDVDFSSSFSSRQNFECPAPARTRDIDKSSEINTSAPINNRIEQGIAFVLTSCDEEEGTCTGPSSSIVRVNTEQNDVAKEAEKKFTSYVPFTPAEYWRRNPRVGVFGLYLANEA